MNIPFAGTLLGRILLVEDNEHVGDSLKIRLESFGLRCDWVKSYDEFQKAFNAVLYHAVITDIYLKANDHVERDGMKIVRDVGRFGTPLIIITSAADLEIAKEGLNEGASYLLEKPFDPSELKKILETLWEEPRGLQALMERFLEIHKLTPKEKEITRFLIKGLSNKEISELTGNAEKTIKFYFTTIYEKCGVQKRSELFNAIFPT